MPISSNAAVEDRLRAIVASVLELEPSEVSAQASFYEDLGVDSLEKVEIAARIEAEFDITLSADRAAALSSVEDACSLLGSNDLGEDLPEPAHPTATRPTATYVGDPDRNQLVWRLLTSQLEAGRGDAPSYLDPQVGAVSYAQLSEAAGGYAGALAAAGIPRGTRCLVLAEDSVATVVAILGLWWHGCVPVPTSPMALDHEIEHVAADCDAGLVHLDLAEARQRTVAASLTGRLVLTGEDVRTAIRTGQANPAYQPSRRPEPHQWPAEDEALLQYTSGSTGAAKGVRHSAAGIEAMIDGFGQAVVLGPDDLVLSTARLSFGYGLGSSLLCPLAAGACSVLLRGAVDVHVVAAAVQRHRPTVLCSVPRLYVALLDALAAGRVERMDSPRLCLSAGESSSADLYRRIREAFDAEVVNCFGATEVMHVVLTGRPPAPDGSLGSPNPGVSVSVRDDAGNPVPDGEPGRLHVVAPTVALGYLDRPEATARTFADGGAYTGDVVERDAEGYLQYVCRADDLLNLGGYKVSPREIEDVVRQVAGIHECAVVGAADGNGLQQAVLYAVPDPAADAEPLRRAIQRAVRSELAVYKRPSRLEFVDELPVTHTGKIAAYQLRDQATRS